MVAKVKPKMKRIDSNAPGVVEAGTTYTLTAFGKVVGKQRQTVAAWIKEGLPVTYLGRASFIRGCDFFEWIGKRKQEDASVSET